MEVLRKALFNQGIQGSGMLRVEARTQGLGASRLESQGFTLPQSSQGTFIKGHGPSTNVIP